MIVITGDYGQLCNRLIVQANFMAAAREYGFTLANPALGPYAEYFDSLRRDALCRFPASRAPVPAALRAGVHGISKPAARLTRRFRRRTGVWPGPLRTIDIGWFGECDLDSPEFLALAARPGLLFAKGWRFRARRSFARHADAIREALTPRAKYRIPAQGCVEQARKDATILVGVHIRHGDYRAFQGGRYFFETELYASRMRWLASLFAPRPTAFLVCSNEPQPPAAFEGLRAHRGPGQAIEDLHALSLCDYLIGPPSTFNQWASFHGRVPLHVMRSDRPNPGFEDFVAVTSFDTPETLANEAAA